MSLLLLFSEGGEPMATLNPQSISRLGLNPSYAAAAGGGDSFLPSKDAFLHVKNGGGAPITVTVATPGTAIPDVAIADLTATVTNGQERMIGPFPAEHFAQPDDGLADVTYSAVTSVTVGVFRVAQP